MTRIETTSGPFPAQALRVRDKVRTRSGAFAEIRWIERVTLDEDFLKRHPEAVPVAIPAHALGRDCPKSDVLLSPGQKVSADRSVMTRAARPAIDLIGSGNARRRPETIFTYTMFICAEPVEVRVEGLWASLEPPRW